MMRRMLLKTMLAMAGDGLRRPVNAPAAQSTPVGVQPGTSNAVVTANRVIVFGTGGGVFVYTPSPGAGNLVASITEAAADPYGNAARPVISAYGTGGNTSFISMVPGAPAALQVGTGDTAEATPGEVTGIVNGSGATRVIINDLRAAVMTGQNPLAKAELQLISPSADLTSSPATVNILAQDGVNAMGMSIIPTQWAVGGLLVVTPTLVTVDVTGGLTVSIGPITSTGGTPASPTKVTNGAWQSMTGLLVNGWGAPAGGPAPSYRLTNDNEVELCGELRQAAAPTSSTIATLPAGYRPATATKGFAAGCNTGVTAGTTAWMQVDTAGVVSLQNVVLGNPIVIFYGRIPLDAF